MENEGSAQSAVFKFGAMRRSIIFNYPFSILNLLN